MSENKMLFIGEKESFISRVLIKKAQDAGADCSFIPWGIDEINKSIGDAILIALLMDEGNQSPEAVLHFLVDTLEEKGLQMIVVGEQYDVNSVLDKVPGELVYKAFSRPVDNTVFSKTVSEYLSKAEAGEFKKSILIVGNHGKFRASGHQMAG